MTCRSNGPTARAALAGGGSVPAERIRSRAGPRLHHAKVDNDPGGILTYSRAGAKFGWVCFVFGGILSLRGGLCEAPCTCQIRIGTRGFYSLLWTLVHALHRIGYSSEAAGFLAWVLDAVERRGNSAALCHVALDRGARMAERFGLPSDVPGWRAVAMEIREAILEEAWDAGLNSLTEHLGGGALDAS